MLHKCEKSPDCQNSWKSSFVMEIFSARKKVYKTDVGEW
jgi:hypothetical protein